MRVRTVLVTAGLAALGVASLSASGAGRASTLGGYRIVFGSGCYGEKRAYSMLADGSGLTPLLPPVRQLTPLAISGDGNTIAYRTGASESYTTWSRERRSRTFLKIRIGPPESFRLGRASPARAPRSAWPGTTRPGT